jgi:hypothetical protein
VISPETFRNLALSFEETEELPHFEKTSFRVKKKIFATYDSTTNTACLKLSPVDQDVFIKSDPVAMYAVPNKWGLQGWTMADLGKVHEDMFRDALALSYCGVAPTKLADKYRA